MAEICRSMLAADERAIRVLTEGYEASKKLSKGCSLAAAETIERSSVYTQSRLSLVEQKAANRCYQMCKESRLLASGESASLSLSEICQNLMIASRLAGESVLSEEAKLVCLSEIYPAEAFIEHEFENASKARKYLNLSLITDQALEDQYGYTMKVAHRLYTASFSIAVLFQQEQVQAAARHTAQLLRLLSGESIAMDESGKWDQERLDLLPAGMREFHAMQVMNVFISFLAALGADQRNVVASALIDELGMAFFERLKVSEEAGLPVSDSATLLHLLSESVSSKASIRVGYCDSVAVALGRGWSRGMAIKLTLDALSIRSMRVQQNATAQALLGRLDHDLSPLVLSRAVRTRLRSRLARLTLPAANKFPSRQPQIGCLAVQA